MPCLLLILTWALFVCSMRPWPVPLVRTFDTARHAPPPPIPTLATSFPVRPPSHEWRIPSPESNTDGPEIIRPIPVSPGNAQPPPPPDGWIPAADAGTEYISLPPPHELFVRTAASASTTTTELQDGREGRQTNPSQPSSNPNPDLNPPVRSRDSVYQPYMYAPAQLPSVASRVSDNVPQRDPISASPLRYEFSGRETAESQPPCPAPPTDRPMYSRRENLVEQWRGDPNVVSTAIPTRSQSHSNVSCVRMKVLIVS